MKKIIAVVVSICLILVLLLFFQTALFSTSRYQKFKSMDTLFRQLETDYPNLDSIDFLMESGMYQVRVVLVPFENEDVMGMMKEIKKTMQTEEFQKEFTAALGDNLNTSSDEVKVSFAKDGLWGPDSAVFRFYSEYYLQDEAGVPIDKEGADPSKHFSNWRA